MHRARLVPLLEGAGTGDLRSFGIAVSTVEKQHARALRLLRAALPAETMRSNLSAQNATNAKVSS